MQPSGKKRDFFHVAISIFSEIVCECEEIEVVIGT